MITCSHAFSPMCLGFDFCWSTSSHEDWVCWPSNIILTEYSFTSLCAYVLYKRVSESVRRKTYGVTLLCILIQNEARTDLQTKCCGTVPRLNVDKNVRFPVFPWICYGLKIDNSSNNNILQPTTRFVDECCSNSSLPTATSATNPVN